MQMIKHSVVVILD